MSRIILTTGGTGGHIFPALAAAEELARRGHKLLFVGATYGLEKKLAADAGIEFAGLPARGIMGKGWRAFGNAFAMLKSIGLARGLIGKFKPDALAGFGGYASFAPVLAARFRGVPILLHEQNAIAGASNRFLARFASKICVSLPQTAGFSQKTILTGNPVRSAIKASPKNYSGAANRLLVLGGSQGAHALNEFIIGALPALKMANIEIMHQTGARDNPKVRAAFQNSGYPPESARIFIEDMAAAYAWADLCLCRAGATTCAELGVAARPAILVPFPAAIHDHQTRNARSLAAEGAAVLLPEDALKPDSGAALVQDLLNQPQKLAHMAKAAQKLGRQDAAARLADELEEISK